MLWPSCSYNLSQHCFGTCCTGKGILPCPPLAFPLTRYGIFIKATQQCILEKKKQYISYKVQIQVL